MVVSRRTARGFMLRCSKDSFLIAGTFLIAKGGGGGQIEGHARKARKMQVLILGAAGMVGRKLTERLVLTAGGLTEELREGTQASAAALCSSR